MVFGLMLFALFSQNVVNAQTTSEGWTTTPVPVASQECQAVSFKNQDEVKVFMANERVKPLAENYQIPAYISSGHQLVDVFNELKTRYPEFYDISSEKLLDAVAEHPSRYAEMLNENKAIRKYYDPNSRY